MCLHFYGSLKSCHKVSFVNNLRVSGSNYARPIGRKNAFIYSYFIVGMFIALSIDVCILTPNLDKHWLQVKIPGLLIHRTARYWEPHPLHDPEGYKSMDI